MIGGLDIYDKLGVCCVAGTKKWEAYEKAHECGIFARGRWDGTG